MNSKERVLTVLKGGVPDRVPFAPNIGQWFSYHSLGDLTGHEKGYYDLARLSREGEGARGAYDQRGRERL